MSKALSRRSFLQSSVAPVAWCIAAPTVWAQGYGSAIERPVFGFIGAGIRYGQLVNDAMRFGPAAAICDVDSGQLERGLARHSKVYADKGLSAARPAAYEDYRRVLDRKDIDVVTIGTPDHWHTKMAIDAMRAGKDVYCEKPLTLTIDEGRAIRRALKDTGRVMQVGAHQRSGRQFQMACALLRSGRIGKPTRLACAIGGSPTSDSLPVCAPPSELNWNRWLGQTPYVPYCASPTLPESGYGSDYPYSRCHVHFRWWYEYGGGKITDWGAHHVDIAMWALASPTGASGRSRSTPSGWSTRLSLRMATPPRTTVSTSPPSFTSA